MKRAVRVRPYNVYELSHADVLNFEEVNSRNVKANAFSGIQAAHHIVYEKNKDAVKISFANEIGGMLHEKSFLRKDCNPTFIEIPLAYTKRLEIDKDKKADLLKLCKFLPLDCHAFYENLPVRQENIFAGALSVNSSSGLQCNTEIDIASSPSNIEAITNCTSDLRTSGSRGKKQLNLHSRGKKQLNSQSRGKKQLNSYTTTPTAIGLGISTNQGCISN
jgi:hypothetical protein